jgi:hypothetical protein
MELHTSFIKEIKALILQSREQAIRAVDHTRVLMYWNIGRRIFEEERAGKERTDYDTYLIKYLSEALSPRGGPTEFGSGFSVRQLELMRQFYKTFPIANALRSQLSWTHYKLLIRIDNEAKREYYQLEAANNTCFLIGKFLTLNRNEAGL